MAPEPRAIARAAIEESITVQQALLSPDMLTGIERAAELIEAAMRADGKLLLFGNGGSATDAAHIAAEFVGRFMAERRALPALALNVDYAPVTAIGNDYGFEHVFARQLEALGRPGDVAVALSTSGRSPNVIAAVRLARSMQIGTIGLTGAAGGPLAGEVDLCLHAASDMTARIQESHILIAHVICDLVERQFV